MIKAILLLTLLLAGCRCTTIQVFVEKDWYTQPGFERPDTHTRIGLNFDGAKWEVGR